MGHHLACLMQASIVWDAELSLITKLPVQALRQAVSRCMFWR